VIDKPAGLLVHPDAKTKTGTLIDWLLAHDPTIGKVGEDPVRPGIVHRLDREVSGLMVVAKSQRAYDDLKRQFAERKVEKRYLALVYGRVMKDEGDIKLRIARSTSQARMAARPAHEAEGRAAWTHYRVRERLRGATLLDLEILSGRTHQIRAHLQAIGHPVVGDALYAPKKIPPRPVASRLMLQSVSLAFDDPASGERRSYSIPPDPAFRELR
jgi:23S rRNA pseudouridine1911/1915/1917 synthase